MRPMASSGRAVNPHRLIAPVLLASPGAGGCAIGQGMLGLFACDCRGRDQGRRESTTTGQAAAPSDNASASTGGGTSSPGT